MMKRWLLAASLTLVFVLLVLLPSSVRVSALDEALLPRETLAVLTRDRATQATTVEGMTVETITVGGVERSYRLHVPSGIDPAQSVALVLSFHGFSGNAAHQERMSGFSAKADQAGFIVAYPEGSDDPQRWFFGSRENAAADLDYVRALLDAVEARYAIDPARIFAAGMSNGAQMSYRLACDLSDRIAAFGLVSGGYPANDRCAPGRAVPIVVFHGTADDILPYEGMPRLLLPVPDFVAGWAARNDCNATPTVTYRQGDVTGQTWSSCDGGADVVFYTVEGKGHSWPGSTLSIDVATQDIDATDALWDFFSAHPLPSA